jgi:hypothetical protein
MVAASRAEGRAYNGQPLTGRQMSESTLTRKSLIDSDHRITTDEPRITGGTKGIVKSSISEFVALLCDLRVFAVSLNSSRNPPALGRERSPILVSYMIYFWIAVAS